MLAFKKIFQTQETRTQARSKSEGGYGVGIERLTCSPEAGEQEEVGFRKEADQATTMCDVSTSLTGCLGSNTAYASLL